MLMISVDEVMDILEEYAVCTPDEEKSLRQRINQASMFIDNIRTADKWISVKDRLPEEGVDVLVYGRVYSERNGIDVDYVDENGDFYYYDKNVTHWMPLPELPAHDREPPVSDDMRDHLRAYIAGAEDY